MLYANDTSLVISERRKNECECRIKEREYDAQIPEIEYTNKILKSNNLFPGVAINSIVGWCE